MKYNLSFLKFFVGKSCFFFKKFQNAGTVPGTRVPSSPKNFGCPKFVPWDTNPTPGTGMKIVGTVPGL